MLWGFSRYGVEEDFKMNKALLALLSLGFGAACDTPEGALGSGGAPLDTSEKHEEADDSSQPSDPAAQAVADMAEAAKQFLASLDEESREAMQFELDDPARGTWSNLPVMMYEREGILTGDLSAGQLKLAFELLRASLSSQGYSQAVDIVDVDQWHRVNNNDPNLGEDLYSFSIFGTPSATEPWSWQFDGHHLCFTFTVKGNQVAMSPSLWGVNPVKIPYGNLEGLRAMGDEVDTAFALFETLTEEQRSVAVINDAKSPGLFAGPGNDEYTIPEGALGLSAQTMNSEQRGLLLSIVETFVLDMEETHAAVRMAEIESGVEDLHFAWMGPSTFGSEIYYRIYGPTVLIELDHAGGNNHIHSVYRNPQNDYGAAMLVEHYARYPHSHAP